MGQGVCVCRPSGGSRFWRSIFAFAFAAFVIAEVTWAADTPPKPFERPSLEIGWTSRAPNIDGRFDPDEWSQAAHIDGLTQATPDAGDVATQRTEVWVMTDGDQLYIAARLWDTNPEEIIAYAMKRDADTRFDDRFGFTIDPFLDRQNGYFFQVNPNGARRDALIGGASF
jgi:hypothetical protein